jgi:[acyl-carrier-protein] S-malonyltransferase
MGRDLAASHPAAAEVYRLADDVLGMAISRLCWEGPAEALTRTSITQPAIVTTSLACAAALAARGIKPDVVVGHSVGEYAALAVAGVLTAADAIRLSQRRGELMEGARAGAMAAVLNLGHDVLEAVCAEVTASGLGTVVVANFNTSDQIVISGDVAAVEKASELATTRGARKVMRLSVGGAFHSPLMQDAVPPLAEALDAVSFQGPAIDFLSSTTVAAVADAVALRTLMKEQMTSQVRWEPTMHLLLSHRPSHVIEVGNGSTLGGMLKKVDRTLEVLKSADPAGIERCVVQVLSLQS